MQPSTPVITTLALNLAETCQRSYLKVTTPFTPSEFYYSLVFDQEVEFGPLEQLELCPNTQIIARQEDGQYMITPFRDTELRLFCFTLFGNPFEYLRQMKVPKGTQAMSLSYAVELTPRLVNPDGSMGPSFDPAGESMIRATTSVSADGTHWSILMPGNSGEFSTQQDWNPIPGILRDVFARSMN